MKTPAFRRAAIAANLTPMIDVVFLLIIFFVVSGSMTRQEEARPVPLPTAAGGEEVESRETGKLVITIGEDGAVCVGSQVVPLDELKERLLREREASVLPLEVRVRADRSLPWPQAESVLLLCAEAGISDLSFSVLPK
ncbi:MAG: biopolymer transporter ExbD [Thermoguttaceae bacterium]|nr:biopolymer transporter ExbD [Thermoguttaceae bacterium]